MQSTKKWDIFKEEQEYLRELEKARLRATSQKKKQIDKKTYLKSHRSLAIINELADQEDQDEEKKQEDQLSLYLAVHYDNQLAQTVQVKNQTLHSFVSIAPYTLLRSLTLTCEILSLENFKTAKLLFLQQLSFYQSKLNSIPADSFSSLPALRSLSFELTNIRRIEKAFQIKSLRVLNLSRTFQIPKIENLQGLEKLEILNLEGNKIQQLENLKDLQNLKVLMLGNNLITNVDYLAQNPLVCLTTLSLFKNQIQVWPVRGLFLPLLRSLMLYDNKLATFSMGGWFPSLQILNLSQNLLFSIHGLHQAPFLQDCDLSFNKFSSAGDLLQNLAWVRGSLKRLKINDNPFWKDAAQPGQSLSLVEQNSQLIRCERRLWCRFLNQYFPELREMNDQKIIILNQESSYGRLCSLESLSHDKSRLVLVSKHLEREEYHYYWQKRAARIFIKQSFPFKTPLMQAVLFNSLQGLLQPRKEIGQSAMWNLEKLYKNKINLTLQKKAVRKIQTQLKRRLVRKDLILRRAARAENKVVKLQSVIRGFLVRCDHGQEVKRAKLVGRVKYERLDPRHQAARKIQKKFKEFRKKLKISRALAKVRVDDPEMQDFMRQLEEEEFLKNPEKISQRQEKFFEENEGDFEFNEAGFHNFMGSQALPLSPAHVENSEMLAANNNYFYGERKEEDELTEIDAKSDSMRSQQLESSHRLIKRNNLVQSGHHFHHKTPSKNGGGYARGETSSLNKSPSSNLNVPSGETILELEKQKLVEERKMQKQMCEKQVSEWGFQNQETKKILAMRYQKKQKLKKQKQLSAEEKLMKFKLAEELHKRRGFK